MANFTVVVVNLGYESFDQEKEILSSIGADLVLAPADCLSEADVVSAASEADAILVREAPVTATVLGALSKCRIVSRYGVGVDNIDLDAAREKGIYVSNVPDYCAEEVSDHAAALLLACIRAVRLRDKRGREGLWETDIQDAIFRTTGKTLGLVGYGKIARAFHRKWTGFLPDAVLVHDPYVSPEAVADTGGIPVDIDRLLAASDYISLHVPLTPETRYLINSESLGRMKKTAILINTSRGPLIQEADLVDALSTGKLLGAGLDVFEQEPPPADHPLKQLDNVVLTSHVGWYSKDSGKELQAKAAQEVFRVLSGKPPENWLNPW
jgi:D-3-phosphoglycerate dehydrogenase / 2-oxoglutarate reductase